MEAQVTFTRYYTYNVEYDGNEADEEQAIDAAYDFFRRDCVCPVADTTYDDVDVSFYGN